MAKLGFGLLVIMQNEWPTAAADIQRYRELSASVGHPPRPPIILTNVSCAESRAEAQERAMTYLGRKWDSIDTHYHFSDGHLATVKGYEFYGKMAKTYSKMKDESFRQKATDFYVKIQVVGTPDDCLQQLAELRRLTGLDHLVTEFSFGGMPHEEAELNMRLFADRVMPVLQRDLAFAAPPRPRSRPRRRRGPGRVRPGLIRASLDTGPCPRPRPFGASPSTPTLRPTAEQFRSSSSRALASSPVWSGDHVSFHNPIFESLTLLASYAGITTRIKSAPACTCSPAPRPSRRRRRPRSTCSRAGG